MKQRIWTLIRIFEVCLFAALILFVASCTDCGPDTDHLVWFNFRGKVWRMWYEKGNNSLEPLSIIDENGRTVPVNSPKLPFQVFPKDGGLDIVPRGTGGTSSTSSFRTRLSGPSAAAPPYYMYLLSDSPQDAVYIVNQATGSLVATVPLPTLPQGIAVNNLGDRVYVTNQGIEAGNPFFPQAPPRVRVIDKATRAVSGMIDLANGTQPGKPVVSPDDRFVYVPVRADRRIDPTSMSGVAIIDAQTRAVVGTVPVSVADWPVSRAAITPDGALLFVVATQTSPARVFVVDTFTREQSATFIVANSAFRDLLVDYTGSKLYLLNQTSLVVYDTATLTEVGRLTIRANGRLNNMALSIDGRSLFVNDELSPTIVRVDTANLRIAGDISFPTRTAPHSSMTFIVP